MNRKEYMQRNVLGSNLCCSEKDGHDLHDELTGEHTNRSWSDIMGPYTVMKRNELWLHLSTWINPLQKAMLSSVLGVEGQELNWTQPSPKGAPSPVMDPDPEPDITAQCIYNGSVSWDLWLCWELRESFTEEDTEG